MEILYFIVIELLRMVWDIYWGLAFGFMLSSVIRAFISTESISAKLGKNTIAATGLSSFFGAISSSCSYAAASMSRTLIIKGATWSNAVSFMVASTNLVFEIFIVIVSLLGWPFFAGEAIGGVFFIIVSALLIAWFYPAKVMNEAKVHALAKEKIGEIDDPHAHHIASSEHSHAGKKVREPISFCGNIKAASGYFYMDVLMVGKDILIGVVIASVLMVIVPNALWKSLFLTGNSQLPHSVILSWNALIGIVIAIFAFVCSVGNIVMATVLWKGGISFGGVIAFILSDLVTIPMLMVFRKYYGNKTMWLLLLILVVSIFLTSLFLDYSFQALNWIPRIHQHAMQIDIKHFEWNYQSWLNLLFIPLSVFYYFWGRKNMQ